MPIDAMYRDELDVTAHDGGAVSQGREMGREGGREVVEGGKGYVSMYVWRV